MRDHDTSPNAPQLAEITPHLSVRHATVEDNAVGRYEVARLVCRPDEALLVRRVWQGLSVQGSSDSAPAANQVRDPAFIQQFDLAVADVRWQLVLDPRSEQDDRLPDFPVDAPTLAGAQAPTRRAHVPGWYNAPLMFLWGDPAAQRLAIVGHVAIRLFADVHVNVGAIRSVSGLLQGESRVVDDSRAFREWFERS